MRKVRMLAIVVAIIVRTATLHGAAEGDRAALLAALQERAATAIPAHVDHDAGEELQAAVRAALTTSPDDAGLAWAAARASIALAPQVNPPITDGAPPAAWIEVRPPLELPWRMTVKGTVDVSLDGSPWRQGATLQPPATSLQIPIDALFHKAAYRPGFHVLRFRAVLRYSGVPFGGPVETRDLPARTYAVSGTSQGGLQAAAFLNSASQARAYSLDPSLPDATLADWLQSQLPRGAPAEMHWTSRWCETRTDPDDTSQASVCALAMIASPLRGHAEVWIKVASVNMSGDRPTWTAEAPTLEGVDLISPPTRSSVPLSELPFALQAEDVRWPRMSVALNAADIQLQPAAPRPGEPVHIRVTVRNTGEAPVHGITLDLMTFDTPERMLLHRRFVRSIPAGDSVVVETNAVFPLGYGGVLVSAMPLSEHTVLGVPLTPDGSSAFSHGARLVRPDLAPRGYADAVRASVGCTSSCANIR